MDVDCLQVVSMSEELRRALYSSSSLTSLDLEAFLPEVVGTSEIITDNVRKVRQVCVWVFASLVNTFEFVVWMYSILCYLMVLSCVLQSMSNQISNHHRACTRSCQLEHRGMLGSWCSAPLSMASVLTPYIARWMMLIPQSCFSSRTQSKMWVPSLFKECELVCVFLQLPSCLI